MPLPGDRFLTSWNCNKHRSISVQMAILSVMRVAMMMLMMDMIVTRMRRMGWIVKSILLHAGSRSLGCRSLTIASKVVQPTKKRAIDLSNAVSEYGINEFRCCVVIVVYGRHASYAIESRPDCDRTCIVIVEPCVVGMSPITVKVDIHDRACTRVAGRIVRSANCTEH